MFQEDKDGSMAAAMAGLGGQRRGLLDGLFSSPSQQALWALGSGLLGVRRGNEGRALMGAMGAYNEAQQQERRNALTDSQIKMQQFRMQQEMRDPELFGKIDPSDFTTESLAKFQMTRNYGDLVLNPRNSKAPSSVLEFDFREKLPEDKRRDFDNIKRAPQKILIGGVPHLVVGGVPYPLSSIDQEMAAGAGLADAKASGAAAGDIRTKAQADLPGAEAVVPVLKERVKQLLEHPGRDYATGWKAVIPPMYGTPQYDFITRHNELRSKAFEQAYQTLKGGGAITEIEGKAATDALIRMDRATSAKEYEAAANDFIKAYEAGVKKIQNKANFKASPQMPSGYARPEDQARAVRDFGMTEKVDRVPGSDPLGIR